MLIQLQLLPSVRCSFSPSLLCRCGDAEQKLIQAAASYLGKTDGAVMNIGAPSGRVIGGRCYISLIR